MMRQGVSVCKRIADTGQSVGLCRRHASPDGDERCRHTMVAEPVPFCQGSGLFGTGAVAIEV